MELQAIYEIYKKSTGICTDTRKIEPGCLFVALKGPNFNGNTFVNEAIKQGAFYAITDEPEFESEKVILVQNGLVTLQNLANLHRKKLGIPVIAVCGSNGKTTTKELCALALAVKYKTFNTRGNLNNHIGVPLSLLSIGIDTEVAVIEMGANNPSEIALLCEIAEPNFGFITNIGKDHLEGFGSMEGVARANGELFDYLQKHNGTAFVNTSEPFLADLAKNLKNIVTYPATNDSYSVEALTDGFYLGIKTPEGKSYYTQLVGKYNFANVATALCLANYFNVDSNKAMEAVCNYQPSNNRSQLLETEQNTILLDAYNANPSSMMAALENLDSLNTGKIKVAILGDMLELGNTSISEHENLGTWLEHSGIDQVMLVGNEMQCAANSCPKAQYFTTRTELEKQLENEKLVGKFILLKGSRGIGLEKLVNFL